MAVPRCLRTKLIVVSKGVLAEPAPVSMVVVVVIAGSSYGLYGLLSRFDDVRFPLDEVEWMVAMSGGSPLAL